MSDLSRHDIADRLAQWHSLDREVADLREEVASLRVRLAAALERERVLCARNRQRDWWAGCVMLARMLLGRDRC